MSELARRIQTAVPLVAALLAILVFAPRWVTELLAGVVMVLGAWEWAAFPGWRTRTGRGAYAAAVALLLALAGRLVPDFLPAGVLLYTALGWWLVALLWILCYPTRVPWPVAALAGVLVLVPAWVALRAILGAPDGTALLLLALAIIFAADIGAYFAGHRFGRVKLAPQVSPGKTWEGLFGGMLLAGAVALVGGPAVGLPAASSLTVGIGVAALSVVGDLTESMFKRSVGAKDSGSLIPGHGGVLDRLDSVTAALPLFALALSWLRLTPP